MIYNKGNGKCIRWLKENVEHDSDDCLIWPFSCDHDGYGQFGYLGRRYKAHRWMCEQRNGPPPTSKHYAAHDCGKGHLSCVNPRHLAWKTQRENALDAVRHGTTRKGKGRSLRKLNQQQVDEILALKGKKSLRDLSETYGVKERHIRFIQQGWGWKGGAARKTGSGERYHRLFTPDEIQRIRRETWRGAQATLANEFGVGHTVIWRIQKRKSYVYVPDEQDPSHDPR